MRRPRPCRSEAELLPDEIFAIDGETINRFSAARGFLRRLERACRSACPIFQKMRIEKPDRISRIRESIPSHAAPIEWWERLQGLAKSDE